MTRTRLPNRRPSETVNLTFDGKMYSVTVGFYADGRPGEVFTGGAKVGSAMDAIAILLWALEHRAGGQS